MDLLDPHHDGSPAYVLLAPSRASWSAEPSVVADRTVRSGGLEVAGEEIVVPATHGPDLSMFLLG